MNSRQAIHWAVMMLLTTALPIRADVERSIDAETQLKSWKLIQGALSLEIIQRLPDQTRGFFLARGFSREIANDIGTQCVLQTIGKNTTLAGKEAAISYNLKDWIVRTATETRGIKLKEQWSDEWQGEDVNEAAKLAFRWATFPTAQSFEPGGDYNWGMISFGLPPGSLFDLQVTWKEDNEIQSNWIRQIECPIDR